MDKISLFSILYQVLITPLVKLTEITFELFNEVLRCEGGSIILLSLTVTLLTLPLYIVAEARQEEERRIQARLKSKVFRIKKTFSGDERYMLLNTLYRQNHYHPVYALRSSFSLLIQIPFFIAAYNFLSSLTPLKGTSFLFINDLGAADNLIALSLSSGKKFYINILPLLMTAINIAAGAIYSHGHEVKEKVQIYLCALVFLVLLYASPSGLVLYWTMNNIFSLVKNVFYKVKNPKKLGVILTATLLLLIVLTDLFLLKRTKLIFRVALFLFCLFFFPLVFLVRACFLFIFRNFTALDENKKLNFLIFILSSSSLALLAGAVIPSIIVSSEVMQYCFVDSYKSPFIFLVSVFFESVGLFIVWPAFFYALFGRQVKKSLSLLFLFLLLTSTINTFFFSTPYGPLLPELRFMFPIKFFTLEIGTIAPFLLNFLISFLVFFTLYFLLSYFVGRGGEKGRKRGRKNCLIIQNICLLLLLSFSVLSIKNYITIASSYSNMTPPNVSTADIKPIYHLSKEGKNVIVIMQDRLFSPLIPQYFTDFKEDIAAFDGFTYYRNCTSFAVYTMLGTPGIFGGYSYTPFEINKDTTKTLQQKHNEAILTLPRVFHELGEGLPNKEQWSVTVSDMPYENYLEYPIESMYKDYPYINRCTTHGVYSDLWYKTHNLEKEPFISTLIKRNFIFFALFKMASPILRPVIYHNDYWLTWNDYDDISKFIDNYSALEALPLLCDIKEENKNEGKEPLNTFLLLDNEATHEPSFIDPLTYLPTEKQTKIGESPFSSLPQYHTIIGVFKKYIDFFQYLKDNDLYDNTRIIIVSDHGKVQKTPLFTPYPDGVISKESYTAALLVKDFGERGKLKVNNEFMTNADTPYLATKDIVKDACNPFTHSLFYKTREEKNAFTKLARSPAQSTRIRRDKRFNIKDNSWYGVKDDIYNGDNWFKYDERVIKEELKSKEEKSKE